MRMCKDVYTMIFKLNTCIILSGFNTVSMGGKKMKMKTPQNFALMSSAHAVTGSVFA